MTPPLAKILVVEDESEIRRFVRLSLVREGFEVHEADGVRTGLLELGRCSPHLVILDLGLPDGEGLSLIQSVREWSQVPVLVLSARSAEGEKVLALDAGADDYLVKPFGTAELLARVRAQLRRRTEDADGGKPLIEFGDIRIDLVRRVVEREGKDLHLTPIEYRLLTYLALRPDRVLTHRQLLAAVWGAQHVEDNHYLRVYMGHLRKKVERDSSQPRHLVTETGVGYRFVS